MKRQQPPFEYNESACVQIAPPRLTIDSRNANENLMRRWAAPLAMRARVCTAFQSADCVKRDQMGPMPVENEAGVLTPAPVDIALALE